MSDGWYAENVNLDRKENTMVGSSAFMLFLTLHGLDGRDIYVKAYEIVAIRDKHVYTKAGKFDVQESAKEIADKLIKLNEISYEH